MVIGGTREPRAREPTSARATMSYVVSLMHDVMMLEVAKPTVTLLRFFYFARMQRNQRHAKISPTQETQT